MASEKRGDRATHEDLTGRVEPGGAQRTRVGWVIGIAVAILLVTQVALVAATFRTGSEVAALRDDVDVLAESGPVLASDDVADLGSGASSNANQSSAPDGGPSSSDPGGNLPRFLGGGADAALGRSLGELTGFEYYGGENVVVDPADGVARAYMVWAHWCPYCQEELPLLAEWHGANAADLENFELVSVTTAIDETADNPLVPYLDANEFPFSVLVDEDGRLSQQLGANAFPFWVFTAPDGTVVGRAAGLIEPDDLDSIFQQLDELEGAAAPAGS